MMNKMIVANLVHRPIRSLISIVAIAMEVTLILLIVGLSVGMLNDARQRQAGIGADVIVQPPNTSFMAGVSNAPMSIKIGGVLAKLAACENGRPGNLAAFDPEEPGSYLWHRPPELRGAGAISLSARHPFQGPNDCLVDDISPSRSTLKWVPQSRY